jgi:ATP-dependent DNA helicase RecQ
VLRLADERQGQCIVYCATVPHVNAVAAALTRAGHQVAWYHGSLSARVRHLQQERFMQGEAAIMVATNAFGMGIDKADIRVVQHYDLPGSLDAYYQEAGRAGRDGNTARAILLFQRADRRLQRFFLGGRHPTVEQFQVIVEALRHASDRATPATVDALGAGTDVSIAKVRTIVTALKEEGLIRERRATGLQLTRELTLDDIHTLAAAYEEKARLDAERLDRMIIFAQTALCRWKLLLEALDEPPPWPSCGICDNCRGTAPRAIAVASGT